MATAKKAQVTVPAESKKAAPRRKPATAAAPKTRKASPKEQIAAEIMPAEIERLAYHLWEERGRPEGTSVEDWNRAQEILLQAR